MSYLRKFILSQNSESIKTNSQVLLKFWGDFHNFVWSSNKTFTSFQGNELTKFTTNIPSIIDFISDEFAETEHVQNLKTMLQTWHDIPKFLGITNIENVECYETELENFEQKVKKFYEVGANTFLTKNRIGDEETFYLHVLRYYIPYLSKITLQKHQLGIGIFTMQGYERRNRESKNCFKRFNNKRGNMVCQNMK